MPDGTLFAVIAWSFLSARATSARWGAREKRTRFGKEELVDDDVVRVDFISGELLDEAFRLVQGQELRDAHADECGLILILLN